jgi:hypothetical protein
MKSSKEQIDQIEEALIAAHRRPEEVQFPAEWRQQLMRDLRAQARPAPASPAPRRILALAAAALAVCIGYLTLTNLDWYDPWINLRPVIIIMDSRADVSLEAGDIDSGLRHLAVTVVQGGKEIGVLSHKVEQPKKFWGLIGSTTKKLCITVVLDVKVLNLHQGPAKLVVEVRDLSWRNNFQGRLTTLEKEIVIHPRPS